MLLEDRSRDTAKKKCINEIIGSIIHESLGQQSFLKMNTERNKSIAMNIVIIIIY
jgi:hypothetical protein